MQTTEKRIFSGVFVGFISFALGFIQAILLVPILLTFWGNETYGIWLVLNAGYIILQTLDSGQQSFIGNEFNIKFFSDKKDLRVVLASSLRIAFLIGIFQLLIVFFLILTNTSHLFLGLDTISVEKEYLSICLLLLVISWISSGTFSSILSKLLVPYGYYAKSIWWSIYTKIGSFIILVAVAVNEGTILDATIGISSFNIIFNYLFLFKVKSFIPEVFPWWRNGDWKKGFENLKKSSLISVTGVLAQLSNNGLVILITYLFGASIVPVYATLRTLTNSATQITNTIIQPLQPDLVKFSVNKDYKKLSETFDLNWIVGGLIINVGILLVLPFLPDLYQIWTRGKIEFDLNLFLLLALAVSIFNFGSVLVFYLYSINRIVQHFSLTVVKLFLLFIAIIILSKTFGLLSVGIGIVLSEFVGYLIIPFFFTQFEFNQNNSSYNFKAMLLKTLPILVLFFNFIMIMIYPGYTIAFSLGGAVVLMIVYFGMWRQLTWEFRERILALFGINMSRMK